MDAFNPQLDEIVRLTARTLVVLAALVGIIVVWSTDQIVPATSAYQAQMRIWLVGRASGFTAYLILTFLVAVGLVLSHPVNKSTWKLSKQIFPWHENLFIFVVAFVAAHIVSMILDPFAGVGIAGAFIPGLSSFRSVPIALGTLGLYGLLITGLTARYTKLLRPGMWLKLHRFSIVVWAVTWAHGILAGTDSGSAGWFYVATGLVILGAAAYRYWVGKQGRPTFATSLPEASGGPAATHAPVPIATAAVDAGDAATTPIDVPVQAASPAPAATPGSVVAPTRMPSPADGAGR